MSKSLLWRRLAPVMALPPQCWEAEPGQGREHVPELDSVQLLREEAQ